MPQWVEVIFGKTPNLSPLRIAGASTEPAVSITLKEQGKVMPASLGAGIGVGMSWRCLGRELVGVLLRFPETPLAYGLGERHVHLNLWGRGFRLWNVDQPMHIPLGDLPYLSIPYILLCWPGRACTAVLVDHVSYAEFDLGRSEARTVKITVETGLEGLRAYLLKACRPAEAVASLARVFPTPTLPPKWGLGYHQSRYSYESSEEVLKTIRSMDRCGVPCNAIYLDIDYMDAYKVFAWNRNRFPDPDKLAGKLARSRVRLVAIVEVGVKAEAGYTPYDEGVRERHFYGMF